MFLHLIRSFFASAARWETTGANIEKKTKQCGKCKFCCLLAVFCRFFSGKAKLTYLYIIVKGENRKGHEKDKDFTTLRLVVYVVWLANSLLVAGISFIAKFASLKISVWWVPGSGWNLNKKYVKDVYWFRWNPELSGMHIVYQI